MAELLAVAGVAAVFAMMQQPAPVPVTAQPAVLMVPVPVTAQPAVLMSPVPVTAQPAVLMAPVPPVAGTQASMLAAWQPQAPVSAANMPAPAWQPAPVMASSTLAPAYVTNVTTQEAASTTWQPQTPTFVTAANVPTQAWPQTQEAAARTLAPAFSEASLGVAGARTRFLYTQAEGVSVPTGAVRKELARYPDHVTFQLLESPPMTQRPDFLLHVVIDSDMLASVGTGNITLAKLMVEENDPGDPSLFYRDGKIYGTQQWDDRTTQMASVTVGGTMEVVYVSDQTSQNAYLRARSGTFDTTVGAKCGGVWATGSNNEGKIHVMLHRCVLRAALMWADAGLGNSVTQKGCLASV
jgi:hypothetical protein